MKAPACCVKGSTPTRDTWRARPTFDRAEHIDRRRRSIGQRVRSLTLHNEENLQGIRWWALGQTLEPSPGSLTDKPHSVPFALDRTARQAEAEAAGFTTVEYR